MTVNRDLRTARILGKYVKFKAVILNGFRLPVGDLARIGGCRDGGPTPRLQRSAPGVGAGEAVRDHIAATDLARSKKPDVKSSAA
jgi:hypothetical protein